MTIFRKFIEMYFSGTYFYFLDKENSQKLEYHWYFAVSAVFMIAAYNLMFLVGLAITFGFGSLILASKVLATMSLIVVLICCWAYFLRAERYRAIVERWVSQRNSVKQFAMRINWLLLGGFFIMMIRLVIVM